MKPISWLKIAVFFASLGPLARLLWRYHQNDLTANPIEFITHSTGLTALIFLLITLGITPLRRITRQYWLIQLRRMLGLFAFFYACLHLATYVVLDHYFDWDRMIADVYKRPYITAGFTAFVLLVPLAITSTSGWVRRLGGRRWQMLHRLIYVSTALAVVHFLWLVKADIREPATYGVVLAVLLGYRLVRWLLSRTQQASGAAAQTQQG
ncbi:MAG TPA: protein-methionine-sulfoxide reductase heme-binding subunit MsrQ [Terriglobales bacterium]|nr:protein-methionine-sulfoxide reductase heme-binding subunit MsrQ [Terriglobales bacterium]